MNIPQCVQPNPHLKVLFVIIWWKCGNNIIFSLISENKLSRNYVKQLLIKYSLFLKKEHFDIT